MSSALQAMTVKMKTTPKMRTAWKMKITSKIKWWWSQKERWPEIWRQPQNQRWPQNGENLKNTKIQNYGHCQPKINWVARILCLYLVNNTEGSEFLVLIWLAKLWGHASLSCQKPYCVTCARMSPIVHHLSSKVVLHFRSSSIKGHLPSKVIFHKRCFPSNIVFHQSLCSITGCLPLNALFQQRLAPGKGCLKKMGDVLCLISRLSE